MGLFFVKIEKVEENTLTVKIDAIDRINTPTIPAKKTFFTAAFSELFDKIRQGYARTIQSPKNIEIYQEQLQRLPEMNELWQQCFVNSFGTNLSVSKSEYEEALKTMSYHNVPVMLTETGSTDGVEDYWGLKLEADKGQAKIQAEKLINNIETVKGKPSYSQTFKITFNPEVFPNILEKEIAWETIASQFN